MACCIQSSKLLMSSSGCPFAGMGVAVFAAIAGLSTLLLNSKRWIAKKALSYKKSLPMGIEEDSQGKLWFREISDFWKGQSFSLEVKQILYSGHTGLQEILVFDSQRYGTVMALDSAIQVTTLDECAYQEVMAHTPMHLIPAGEAKRALVIGGGDGGVLRELAKYPELEEIYICEIDGGVIDISKKYLKSTAVGYQDPRVTVFVEDGFKFLERMVEQKTFFDFVVSDLSDPIGPAESIFNNSFIRILAKVVNPVGGVAALQGECYWLHAELIKEIMKEAKKLFPNVEYASIAVPTYPCGQIGCIVMSHRGSVAEPVRSTGLDYDKLAYYTRDLHRAQFVLPKFVSNLLY